MEIAPSAPIDFPLSGFIAHLVSLSHDPSSEVTFLIVFFILFLMKYIEIAQDSVIQLDIFTQRFHLFFTDR